MSALSDCVQCLIKIKVANGEVQPIKMGLWVFGFLFVLFVLFFWGGWGSG